MIDSLPHTPEERPKEDIDWEALMEGYDWKINIPTDSDDPDYKEGLDMVSTLREQYGYENVVVNRAVMNPDTAKLAKAPGRLGVHVRTSAEPTDLA